MLKIQLKRNGILIGLLSVVLVGSSLISIKALVKNNIQKNQQKNNVQPIQSQKVSDTINKEDSNKTVSESKEKDLCKNVYKGKIKDMPKDIYNCLTDNNTHPIGEPDDTVEVIGTGALKKLNR